MNTEARTPSRFAKAGSGAGQSTAMVVNIDNPQVKSTANFNQRMDALEKLLTSSLRFHSIALVGLIGTLLVGFAGLIYALLMRSHTFE